MYENIDSLQEIRVTIEGKVLVFQERSSTVCREIFSEGVRCAQKPDLGDSRLFYVTRQVELQGKTNFARNHDVTTAAVPRENVKNMLCIKKTKDLFLNVVVFTPVFVRSSSSPPHTPPLPLLRYWPIGQFQGYSNLLSPSYLLIIYFYLF